MLIHFLGSGSAFVLAEENYQSNILIEWEEEKHEKEKDIIKINKIKRRLLYDAGSTIAEALNKANLEPKDIDAIFISHLHADHIGGIEYIAFKTYFSTFPFGQDKKYIIGNHLVLDEGWDYSWKGGLRSLQNKRADLDTYFKPIYVEDNGIFKIFGKTFEPIQTIHIIDNRSIINSYGLRFKTENKKTIFITGDTQFAPNQLLSFYDTADYIFQDCEFACYPNGVHAQYHELKTLPVEIKKKMYLYHYALNGKTYTELKKEVIKDGFAGLVKRGDKFSV